MTGWSDSDCTRGLLLGDVVLHVSEIAGLDEVAELFAVEPRIQDRDHISQWGRFWADHFVGAPSLPMLPDLPDDGGFVLRRLSVRSDALTKLIPDGHRCVLQPPRYVHSRLNFPEPRYVSNDVFVELRYALAPSVVRFLEFDDIRDGILRIFIVPELEGDMRFYTIVDEAAVTTVLADADSLQVKRLTALLHAVAASPPAVRWPSTLSLSGQGREKEGSLEPAAQSAEGAAGELFPHQVASIDWMRKVEERVDTEGANIAKVESVSFAGMLYGTAYDVPLPCGGVLAHPPGAGKTRIVTELHMGAQTACTSSTETSTKTAPFDFICCRRRAQTNRKRYSPSVVQTVVLCPTHLVNQWGEEFRAVGASQSTKDIQILGFDQIVDLQKFSERLRIDAFAKTRIVVDEPQDCDTTAWAVLTQFREDVLRSNRIIWWVLCGTAASHIKVVGRLVMGGWVQFHVAKSKSEWLGTPEWPHIVRHCFLADPPWACLPMPPLDVLAEPVTLRQSETADAAVASLAGFVLDSILLLSFGARAASAAAQERDELLQAMGWLGSVGTSLLPGTEYQLSEWEGVIEQRGRQKLEELDKRLQELEAQASAQRARYTAETETADLAFLTRDSVHMEVKSCDEEAFVLTAATAEWNVQFEGKTFSGIALTSLDAKDRQQAYFEIIDSPADGDCSTATTAAAAAGALGVIFVSESNSPLPVGYHHDHKAPEIPAVVIGQASGARLRQAAYKTQPPTVYLTVAALDHEEERDDAEQGLLGAFLVTDTVDVSESGGSLAALRVERAQCLRALNFAAQMRELLESDNVECPVCIHDSGEGEADADAFAVMPDCFHVLCKTCLEKTAGYAPSFNCPLCRTPVPRLDVVVFQRPVCPAVKDVTEDDAVVQGVAPELPGAVGMEGWQDLPSKLQRFIMLVHEILGSGPEEHILVFAQWAVHVQHLQSILEDHGIPVLSMVGSLTDTMDALARFGTKSAPRVLLLSSQLHSAGVNLQMARHVVIVHPFCTPTASSRESISQTQMLAYERQAIGRVRRYPQTRPVRIYRLYATHTIEEELYAGRWSEWTE